jgi:arginyl-tRNA--protein-N-Asp/Glu arginylyltransferase
VRIDLTKFQYSSENRRILKKAEELSFKTMPLPLAEYDFKIGKLAKDFYEAKFGPGIMSANKIKELVMDQSKSNFNTLLEFSTSDGTSIGYTIAYSNPSILHYSYPFYDLQLSPKSMGMCMMILSIKHALETGRKYIYLGSLQRPGDAYKLQFSGMEWFDGKNWQTDITEVKKILSSARIDQ